MRSLPVLLVTALWVGDLRSAPAPAARPAQILYASPVKGVYQLFTVEADGKNAKQLTEEQSSCLFPAWSPDGKKIAYSLAGPTAWNLYVIDADGKNQKQLTKGQVFDRGPAWSPDGKKIAFSRTPQNGNSGVNVIPADGGDAVNLTGGGAFDADPAWSPDGQRIAFASNRSGNGFRLYVMDANGKNVTDVSGHANAWGFVYPSWSPDGKKIAYADSTGQGVEVFTIDPDGKNKKQLTNLGQINSYPTWSPDGKKIAFLHFVQNGDEGVLQVIDADGGNVKKVFDGSAGVREGGRPAWRPR